MLSLVLPPDCGPGVSASVGDVPRELVTRDSTGGAFTVTELSAPAGWQCPAYVDHAVDECFYVVEGEFEVVLDDREGPVQVGPRTTLYVPRGIARRLRIVGTSPGVLLLLQTPGRSSEESLHFSVELVDRPFRNRFP
jgi:mannose-6-phosphate isomerase-like protein (cupin superfamily)